MTTDVTRIADLQEADIVALLHRFDIQLSIVADDQPIPGSYWGDPEAGIVARTVHVRSDTPVHSLLHETCHIVCMSEERRACLERDAGSDDLEEAAVCYLQVVLADHLGGMNRDRLMSDMDAWGYSFRLGETHRWFTGDADDARDWLVQHELLTADGVPIFQLRQ